VVQVADDALVAQRAQHLRFVGKARAGARVGVLQELDGHLLGRAGVDAAIDHPHAALAHLLLQYEAAHPRGGVATPEHAPEQPAEA
jgi:hypothetical protein